MELSDEQRTLVESHIWVVYAVMKKHRIADNDLCSDALLYLCTVALRFDPERGVKFSTYAYTNTELYVKRRLKEEKKKQERVIVGLPEYLSATQSTEDEALSKVQVEACYNCMSKKAKIVAHAVQDGLPLNAACAVIGSTRQSVQQIWKRAKEKVKNKLQ